MNLARMLDALAWVALWLVSAVVLAKIFIFGIRLLIRRYTPPWLKCLERIVPTWQLFGTTGGRLDLRAVIGDFESSIEEHFHELPGFRRYWFFAVINPYARHTALLREALRSVARHRLSGTQTTSDAVASTILERTARLEVWRRHPAHRNGRRFNVYVVVDPGHDSSFAPEARVVLGPFAGD